MRNAAAAVSAVLLLAVLCGCTSAPLTDTVFFAMDTVITLRLPADTAPELTAACEAQTAALEARLSRTVKDSDTAQFNASVSGISPAQETAHLLDLALLAADATDGAYDPTVAPLAELWDVTSPSPRVPDAESVRTVLPHIGYRLLTWDGNTLGKTDPEVRLDFGGCAKGYACEAAVRLLEEAGVPMGVVSFGGNIGVFGEKADGTPWRVGIRHPDDAARTAGYLSLTEGFLSVSGDYERYFIEDGVRYHHIMDAETGYPAVSGIRSAAVWSTDGTLADALSTALFVLGAERSMALYNAGTLSFEAVLYTSDGRTVITPGIADRYEHAAPEFSAPAP